MRPSTSPKKVILPAGNIKALLDAEVLSQWIRPREEPTTKKFADIWKNKGKIREEETKSQRKSDKMR